MSRLEERHQMVMLLVLGSIACYADRSNIAVVLASTSEYSNSEKGLVLSAFFIGYVFTQLPGAWSSKHFGAKATLLVGVSFWTLCDLLTVPAFHNIIFLCISRIGMGLGEGVLFPSLHHLSGKWFPLQERATLVSLVSSGQDMGAIIAVLVAPYIIDTYGWQWVFVIFAIANVVWLFMFGVFCSNTPESSSTITEEELAYITENRIESPPEEINSMHLELILSKPGLAILSAHCTFNYMWYVLLSWIPAYFKEELGLDLKENAFLTALPYICGLVGMTLWGRFSDSLISHRVLSIRSTRRLMNSIGQFLPALCLLAIGQVHTTSLAILLLCIALFCGRAVSSGFWVNMIDVAPNHAGSMMALSNTIATLPGILGNFLSSWILQERGSWNLVFAVAAILNLIGGAIFAVLVDSKQELKSIEYTTLLEVDHD